MTARAAYDAEPAQRHHVPEFERILALEVPGPYPTSVHAGSGRTPLQPGRTSYLETLR